MDKTKAGHLKKYFLMLSFVTVAIIALLYGIDPQWFGRSFLGINPVNPNVAHILRAVMGLYLALGIFWIYAAFSDKWRNAALLTTAIFAGGLVCGRIISLFSEGLVSAVLTFYMVIELLFVPIALWIYRLED